MLLPSFFEPAGKKNPTRDQHRIGQNVRQARPQHRGKCIPTAQTQHHDDAHEQTQQERRADDGKRIARPIGVFTQRFADVFSLHRFSSVRAAGWHVLFVFPDQIIRRHAEVDTLKSGVPNAIRVFTEMREAGIKPKSYGIRLDSGDLAYLSKKARKMLDDAGFQDAVIAASNDLDEFLIHDLKMQGAAISSWGVGTNLITSKDCPSFGGVYKLAAIQNAEGEFQPKIKISENIEKITNPGNKTIYRIYDKETGMLRADLICFADETFNTEEDLLLFDPNATWKKTLLPGGSYTMRELLVPIFQHGECKYESPSVKEIAEFCRQEKETLWDETKRLFNPHKVYVDLSQKLYDTKTKLLNEAHH